LVNEIIWNKTIALTQASERRLQPTYEKKFIWSKTPIIRAYFFLHRLKGTIQDIRIISRGEFWNIIPEKHLPLKMESSGNWSGAH